MLDTRQELASTSPFSIGRSDLDPIGTSNLWVLVLLNRRHPPTWFPRLRHPPPVILQRLNMFFSRTLSTLSSVPPPPPNHRPSKLPTRAERDAALTNRFQSPFVVHFASLPMPTTSIHTSARSQIAAQPCRSHCECDRIDRIAIGPQSDWLTDWLDCILNLTGPVDPWWYPLVPHSPFHVPSSLAGPSWSLLEHPSFYLEYWPSDEISSIFLSRFLFFVSFWWKLCRHLHSSSCVFYLNQISSYFEINCYLRRKIMIFCLFLEQFRIFSQNSFQYGEMLKVQIMILLSINFVTIWASIFLI